ncbi:sensor histidine kinase [Phanerochaete sordida]|uniref:Sensor histidine kinase n=1 Tax=Phanerochaete sordida TaxID=48140 RepID=A0A9P3GDH5_9APHY|nr:sensor histidine kinase [Phanerochaete sordida]
MSKVAAPSVPRKNEDTPKSAPPVPPSPNGKVADARPAAATSSRASVPPSSPPASPAARRAVSEAPSAVPEADDEPEPEAADSTIIDLETFQQILDLDDDEDSWEFSSEMVWQYFDQASTTFEEMKEAFEAKDLLKLSNLGHFLKGSSAALGVCKVQATCEKIQHYGKMWDDENGATLTPKEALSRIEPLLTSGKQEYEAAEKWLRSWYKERGVTGPPQAD